jgi:PIN domain nuclease of toxin-antitoxin system
MAEVLIDTHTLLWFDITPAKLSATAQSLLQDPSNVVFVSSMTAWEIGIKYAIGKLPDANDLVTHFHQKLSQYGFLEVAFTSGDALRAASLPATHKDPFDRALVAQALERNIPILSVDGVLDSLGVTRIW